MRKIKWVDTIKHDFDELLFKTLFAKVKKTETNIKRIDRFKKTVAFLLFQIVAISLFCIFGIAESRQLTYEDTIVIINEIDDYTHIDFHAGRINRHWYDLCIDEQEYRLFVNDSTCEKMQEIIKSNHTIEFRVYNNDVVEFYFNDIEIESLNNYNKNQAALRIFAIVLFSLVEVIAIAVYVSYIILHRTSKDKRFI